jgi:SAM-dependent methyltransferase
MASQMLDHLGNAHASYVHARGKLSTNKMFELLVPLEGEKVLEIGFGTGATLVQFAARSKASFFGYEMSPIMYQKALERIRCCRLSKRINLTLLKKKNQFPAPDNTFDRIYCESIIAIQEGNDFRDLLLEIKRVLKTGGVLLFNETIWLESISKGQAEEMNERCKQAFGIIQANHDYPHVADWKQLLREIGFEPQFEMSVAEIQAVKGELTLPVLISNAFTWMGKMKVFLSPRLRREREKYAQEMAAISSAGVKLMEGYLIQAPKIQ